MSSLQRIAAVPFRVLTLICLHMYRIMFGKAFVLRNLQRYERWVSSAHVLRVLGATVGAATRIEGGLRIQNAEGGDCSNLWIGRHVYIGPEVLLDLASSVRIEDDAALSARVTVVTHAGVGDRPLRSYRPRQQGPVVIGHGSWVGVGAVILHGVTIGTRAIVGASSLVNRSVPADTTAYGIPCRVVRSHQYDPSAGGSA